VVSLSAPVQITETIMDKVVLFAFRGDLLCFVHVLLNGLDMKDKGMDARIVFEGESVNLVGELEKEGTMFRPLYLKAKEAGIIDGACKACSAKLGATEAVKAAGLPLLEGVQGHPSMADYMAKGYKIITF